MFTDVFWDLRSWTDAFLEAYAILVVGDDKWSNSWIEFLWRWQSVVTNDSE